MRTGTDLDHQHPSCSALVTSNCLPKPFDGELLQIMPWPAYQNMTIRELRAIYEYLRAIPCIADRPLRVRFTTTAPNADSASVEPPTIETRDE